MNFLNDEGISERIKLKLLDADSIRSIREALIETLPPQSAARAHLVEIEDKAEVERGKMRARSAQKER